MGNQDLSLPGGYVRFRTKRQKKRLQKKDRDKQLIRLYKKQEALFEKERTLPLIPLETPYQRGWIRFFVLREDVKRSKDALFFQTLLDKINTEEFSPYKGFKIKKRRHGKKIFETAPQFLNDISVLDWERKKYALTEKEKSHFYLNDIWLKNWNCFHQVYSFDQPWRFVLKIKPNIITHRKLLDIDLISEIKEVDNYLVRHHLFARLRRLVNGRKQSWKSCRKDKAKYIFQYYRSRGNNFSIEFPEDEALLKAPYLWHHYNTNENKL